MLMMVDYVGEMIVKKSLSMASMDHLGICPSYLSCVLALNKISQYLYITFNHEIFFFYFFFIKASVYNGSDCVGSDIKSCN